ncbi:MAG TPA: hypothetical protein VHB25_11755 [Gemmatimonadaceae bacterium]|nr:hypothetical protein [Gemmatimonadaceae bacterium]
MRFSSAGVRGGGCIMLALAAIAASARANAQAPAATLPAPCLDSTYQVLRGRPIDSLSTREYAAFALRDRACVEAMTSTATSGGHPVSPSSGLNTTAGSVGKLVAAVADTAHANLVGVAKIDTNPLATVPSLTPLRQRGWFSLGLGAGTLGCSACEGHQATGLSGGLVLGHAINQSVLLGVGTTGWYKSEDGAAVAAGTVDLRIREYMNADSRFFSTVGFGLGHVSAAVDWYGAATEYGLGYVIGLGYDAPLSQTTALTPYFHYFGVHTQSVDVHVAQFGLAVTWF